MAKDNSIIVVEDKLSEIFSYIPNIKHISRKEDYRVHFSYGDRKSLESFLKRSESKESPYPLIWLLYPYTEEHSLNKVHIRGMQLILAVQTNYSMSSEDRMNISYKKVLYPLFDYIVEAFKLSVNINKTDEIKAMKFPNYSDEESSGISSAGSFNWDAIKLTFDITITNACFKPIRL